MRAWRRRDTICLALVAAVALLVRITYLVELSWTPFFRHLFINAAKYDTWARSGYPPDEPYYQAPLYIYFLKLVYACAPEESRLVVARGAQALLGSVTAAFAYLGGWRFGGALAGCVAGVACACAGPLIYFDGEILPASLATFALTGTLLLLVRAETAHPARATRWLLPGLCLGLAATCRPNFLLLAPTLALCILWRDGRAALRASERRWRTVWMPVALLTVAVSVPVLVVTASNLRAGQGFVLITANLGQNLLLGHNSEADGLNPFPPDGVSRLQEQLRSERKSHVEQSRVMTARALEFMEEHPGQTMRLWWKKLWLFYNRAEIPNNRSIAHQVGTSAVLGWPPASWLGLGLLLPLGLAGLIVVTRQPGVRVPYLLILTVLPLSLMPFLVCARFRAPAIPVLAILTGAAVAHLVTRPPARDLVLMVGLMVLGVFVAWPSWYGVAEVEFLPLSLNRAKLFQEQSDRERREGHLQESERWLDEARRTLMSAADEFPGDPSPHERLGYLHRNHGDPQRAEQAYRAALAIDGGTAAAHFGLAIIAKKRKDVDAALSHLRSAIASDARPFDYHSELGLTLYLKGDFPGGVRAFEEALRRASASSRPVTEARLGMGRSRVAEASGDLGTAETQLRRALDLQPKDFTYQRELCRFLARHGRRDEALAAIDRALPLAPSAAERDALLELRRRLR